MGTIADKLLYTAQARDEIRKAIIAKGVQCPGNAPFCSFDDYIALIQGGGSGGGGSGDGQDSAYCSHIPIVKISEGGYTVAFVEPSGMSLSDSFSGFSIKGRVSIGSIHESVEYALVILQQTIAAADLTKWMYDSDRYVHVVDSSIKLKTSWTYTSEEQPIDSGRMTVVKAVTTDLNSVESVVVV